MNRAALEQVCRDLLVAIGEDPDREGLQDTPRRWAGWWAEFLSGQPPEKMGTTFKAVAADQLVMLKGIRAWSLCEHHLLPFWCDITVAYVAQDRIMGISKLARIARHYAARLQVQERLVTQIADEVAARVGTRDVAVVARGQHLCMQMRGVCSEATMVSSDVRGLFREEAALRAELMSLEP